MSKSNSEPKRYFRRNRHRQQTRNNSTNALESLLLESRDIRLEVKELNERAEFNNLKRHSLLHKIIKKNITSFKDFVRNNRPHRIGIILL
ncbi:hypothetical protein HJ201_09340 [Vibrio parahaemolyticus]|nr:hypothetical protein [Vibrio parahaemolyticus]